MTTRRDKILAELPRPHTERYLADGIAALMGGKENPLASNKVLVETHTFLDHQAEIKAKGGRPRKWANDVEKNRYYNSLRKKTQDAPKGRSRREARGE